MPPGTRSSCLRILDDDAPGTWNMAVDEALLEYTNKTGQPALRIYGWSEPTLSLGYFQPHIGRDAHEPSLHCPLVRRRSGGGAILHDDELTYALTLPIQHRWGRAAEQLYDTVHATIAEWMAMHGCQARLYDDEPRHDAFLCFHRRARGDVVSQNDEGKLLGSAQRRRKSALLQHGSLLIGRSACAPSLRGLRELTQIEAAPFEIPKKQIDRQISDRVLDALTMQAEHTALPDSIRSRAAEIESATFGNPQFTLRR